MKFEGRDKIVKAIQRKLGIVADGVDGPITWRTILSAVTEAKPTLKDAEFSGVAKRMVGYARDEIGVSEIDGSNCGPRVNEYKAATWLDAEKPWPWCAAFICWLIREAMKEEKVTFKRPRTAGAWDFENWARKEQEKGVGIELIKPIANEEKIKAGDIVVFRFSHIGLAIEEPNTKGYVSTIEGNTNGAGSREGGSVLEKSRHIDSIRSVIRIL